MADPFTQGVKGSPGRPKHGRDIITKTALAAEVGVSLGRIRQLIARGLPVRSDGKVWRDQALGWIRSNTAGPNRPQGLPDPVLDARPVLAASATYGDARRVGEIYKAQRLRIAAEREQRSVLERDEVESELVVQSRRLRDACCCPTPATCSCPCTAGGGLCCDGARADAIAVNLSPLSNGSPSVSNGTGLFCSGQLLGFEGCFGSPACRTITENGTTAAPISTGTPASVTLASVFCIEGTPVGLIDALLNVPGPGAVALPGTFLVHN